MNNDEMSIEFDGIVKSVDLAVLFKIGDRDYWLPKSQIRIYEKNKKIYAPIWLLHSKGLL